MRLLITADKDSSIDGFEKLLVEKDNYKDIEKVIDSSCTMIVLESAADCLPYEQAVDLVSGSFRKVRINGSLIIRGVSFDLLCSVYKSNEINIEIVNKELFKYKSAQDHKNIIYVLEHNNFTIDTVTFDGLLYEIKAIRNG
jgi:hypothetical protein